MEPIEIGARYRIFDKYRLGSNEVIGVVQKLSNTNDGVMLNVPQGTLPGVNRGVTEVWVRPQQLLRVQDAAAKPVNDEANAPTHEVPVQRPNIGFVAYIGTKDVAAFHIAKLEPAGTSTLATDLMGNMYTLTGEFMKKHEPEVGGYIVMYKDGYMSYSPPEAFEEAYRLTSGSLTIGDVHRGLNEGRYYARAGWNGRGMFIGKQRPDERSKMTEAYTYMVCPPGSTRQYENETTEHLVPWLCSQGDFYATDWVEVLV